MIFNIKSKVSVGALIAVGIASAVLAGSVSPADAHKSGRHEKHSKNDKPKTPVIQGQWHATKPQPVMRDHRPAVVRDQRATPQPYGAQPSVKVSEDKTRPRGQSSKGNKACVGSVCVTHPKLGGAVNRNIPR